VAQIDREVLFANESFVIGVLQAVSGGSLVAALSQSDTLIEHAGRLALVGFLTVSAIALLAAVLAAYWKHQYKMWDIKAAVSVAQAQNAEAVARSELSNKYLRWMRRAMLVAVIAIAVALFGLVIALWVQLSYVA
jgi:F0F1-type ATP synthase membrane subunit c/vacuolar-type H+-ATPase subunit K